tara:strand:- start:1009 stop:1650 length:642 start_codon:yes stop_codon:yes gene_type:complete
MNTMCGRFTFDGQQWPELVASIEHPETEPNYNISPQSETQVIHYNSEALTISSMRWGLRPSWSKKSSMEPINARLESVEMKPMFREAYKQRRCIIPANGWYEWKTTPRGKVPFYHKAENDSIVLMAGIYEEWSDQDNILNSFCILTKDASREIAHIHNRMPVLIDSNSSDLWLRENVLSTSESRIDTYPVGREVNSTSAQGKSLIQPLRTLFD